MHHAINPHNTGKPRVTRGEYGWLVVTHKGDETHVWTWRPLHRWQDAVTFATELAWQMIEYEFSTEAE